MLFSLMNFLLELLNCIRVNHINSYDYFCYVISVLFFLMTAINDSIEEYVRAKLFMFLFKHINVHCLIIFSYGAGVKILMLITWF